MFLRRGPAVVLCALCAAALSACGAAHPANPRTGKRIVHVVAGENMWGDIATQIGGAHVAVTSIIHSPSVDPHLYESSPQDAAAVETANVAIVNGAGYDDFMNRLLGASSGTGRRVLNVADVLGAHGADPNPHFWYDVLRVTTVAYAIERALARADPRDRPAFRTGLARFGQSLAPVLATVRRIRARYAGAPVAYTERVPGYLVAGAGLRNWTPSGFARAIEDGNEPSPSDRAAMDALISGHRIKALLYNAQAVSAVTKSVRAHARRAGIPVVAVTETLPPGLTFQGWQNDQDQALLRALGGGGG